MDTPRNKTVFIIEDDTFISSVYERIFRMSGISAVIEPESDKGIEKLKTIADKPSAIILDVMMAKMNGFEVLQELKKDPALRDIPVLVLSNLSGKEDVDHALGLGAADYMVKSEHDPEEIAAKVLALIGEPPEKKAV